MNEGLVASVVFLDDEADDKLLANLPEDDDRCSSYPYDLPPDIALIGCDSTNPKMLDKVM